jgi:hypothetical protein
MSLNDLIKYLTQQFVSYLDKPKDQRVQTKHDRKVSKPPLLSRWFGVLPLGFMLFMKKRKK